MAITNAVCNSFKLDLLFGRHNFAASGGHTFNIALYLSTSNLGAATTAWNTASASNEVATGGGYTQKGIALTRVEPSLDTNTAITDFGPADPVWAASTITANGALIFNDTITTPVADAAVVSLAFGGDKTSSAGDFTVVMPPATAAAAIIRIL